MVVKNQIKFVKSLQQKKYRNQSGMFVVEGIKSVRELLRSDYMVEKVYVTDPEILEGNPSDIELVTERELKQMSGLQHPNTALGVFHIPKPSKIEYNDWILALDDVRDPGNLGTIIRLCDWFGIQHLICSEHTVDCYNPKVLQATMGSITRVNIGYTDLHRFLGQAKVPIYGAFMEGSSIYQEAFPKVGILLMGNEGKGISEELSAIVSKKVSIPRFGGSAAESLNVAMATSILLNEIRREE
ncbi:RNA methyltransferase [Flavobacteriaceae bacterium TP-CH-4]|uniref:RNA methyltransferase n=1 Tax=Pelagihabitans pacificus TaxID=2696054 RepID=A0A967E820_9FLAO|nr:RNA methyltransferase [Pelagihabitans pacificus]NHF60844.1 RNA methyltransferase [Pelagihabitans pacificus]